MHQKKAKDLSVNFLSVRYRIPFISTKRCKNAALHKLCEKHKIAKIDINQKGYLADRS